MGSGPNQRTKQLSKVITEALEKGEYGLWTTDHCIKAKFLRYANSGDTASAQEINAEEFRHDV